MNEHFSTETILDYLHGVLPSAEDARIYAHLQACESCRKEYDTEAALGEELRVYARTTERELPSQIKAEIWSRIRSARPAPLTVLAGWLRPAVAIPLAAAIAIGAYFGSTSLIGQGVPAIDAAYYLRDHAAMTSTVPFSSEAAFVADVTP